MPVGATFDRVEAGDWHQRALIDPQQPAVVGATSAPPATGSTHVTREAARTTGSHAALVSRRSSSRPSATAHQPSGPRPRCVTARPDSSERVVPFEVFPPLVVVSIAVIPSSVPSSTVVTYGAYWRRPSERPADTLPDMADMKPRSRDVTDGIERAARAPCCAPSA